MIMTFTPGYALTSSDSLEELDMGGGSTVELDDQIPEELYRATAQVIAFVLSLRGELRRPSRDGHRS